MSINKNEQVNKKGKEDNPVKDAALFLSSALGSNVSSKANEISFGGERIIISTQANLNKPPGWFKISTSRSKQVSIQVSNDAAVSSALYFYLEQLGFRWFSPNERWTITPKLKSIIRDVNVTRQPDFSYREVFSTYGYKNPKDWNRWLSRIGMGRDINLERGHYGNKFNIKYKAEIEKNTNWWPLLKNKRQPWRKTMKLDFAEEGVIQLYIKDAKERLKAKIASGKQAPYFVNIEPADGGGFSESSAAKKMGSISDNVFNLANRVAKELKSIHPEAYVSVLAYSHHSATPAFALEDNVFVSVTPYWYQNTSSPEKLIKEWSANAKRKGLRVYQNLPKSIAIDIPKVNWTGHEESINLAQSLRYEAFISQSSFSAGANALPIYVNAKVLWDNNLKSESVLDDFLVLGFKKAQLPMRRLYTKVWNENFNLETDLFTSYDLIQQAASAENDSDVQYRLNDLKAYVHYLYLLKKAVKLKSGEEKRVAIDEIITYCKSIHDRKMVNTELFIKHVKKKKSAKKRTFKFRDYLPLEENLISDAEVEKNFKKDLESFRKTNSVARSFETPIPEEMDVQAPTKQKITFPAAKGCQEGTYRFKGTGVFQLVNDRGTGSLDFSITMTKAKKGFVCTASLFNASGELVAEQKIEQANVAKNIRFQNIKSGSYSLKIWAKLCTVVVRNPQGIFYADGKIKGVSIGEAKRYYFKIPANTSLLTIRVPQKSGPVAIGIHSDVLKSKAGATDAYVLDLSIPKQSYNQLGFIDTKNINFHLLNIPHQFAICPDQLQFNH